MWPEEATDAILVDFDDVHHQDLVNKDISSGKLGSVGDRRQELVLIGMGMDDDIIRDAVKEALDECLLTDEEMKEYVDALHRDNVGDELVQIFTNPLPSRLINY